MEGHQYLAILLPLMVVGLLALEYWHLSIKREERRLRQEQRRINTQWYHGSHRWVVGELGADITVGFGRRHLESLYTDDWIRNHDIY